MAKVRLSPIEEAFLKIFCKEAGWPELWKEYKRQAREIGSLAPSG